MEFVCVDPDAIYREDKFWKGSVKCIKKEGKTIEAQISGKGSRMIAIIGRYINGNYICIPDWGIGSPLASLDDRLWNMGQLGRYMSRPDAITITDALFMIKKEGMV